MDWINAEGCEEINRSSMGRAQELLLRAADDQEFAIQLGSLQQHQGDSTSELWTHRQLYHEQGERGHSFPLSLWHDIPVAVCDLHSFDLICPAH